MSKVTICISVVLRRDSISYVNYVKYVHDMAFIQQIVAMKLILRYCHPVMVASSSYNPSDLFPGMGRLLHISLAVRRPA